MAKKTLVTALQALIKEYNAEDRSFLLVMLIPTEPGALDTKYTILFSAQWLDPISPKAAIDALLHKLIDQLGSTMSPAYRQIARISVIHSSDPFVAEITSAFSVTDGYLQLQDRIVHDVHIEHAILLESHRIPVFA